MQPDPILVAETGAWFQKANDDLAVAEYLLTASGPRLGVVVFHCQQAAEKALKGFLMWHDEPFRKTHHLTDLGEQCVAIDPMLTPTVSQASTLTDYVWKFRYPGSPDAPSEIEARQALELARTVYEAILQRLPPEVRPAESR